MGRITLIRAQTAMRSWVEGPVEKEVTSIAQQTRPRPKGGRETWLSNLTNHVVDMLVHRTHRKVFKSSDYVKLWEYKEVEVVNPYKGKRLLRGEDETVTAARTITLDVVEQWVGADDHCDRKQAWFASIVKEVLGEEALTLNLVWRLYSNLKPSHIILGDRGYRNPTIEDMEPF